MCVMLCGVRAYWETDGGGRRCASSREGRQYFSHYVSENISFYINIQKAMDHTASDDCKENQQQVDANNFISNFDRAKAFLRKELL